MADTLTSDDLDRMFAEMRESWRERQLEAYQSGLCGDARAGCVCFRKKGHEDEHAELAETVAGVTTMFVWADVPRETEGGE